MASHTLTPDLPPMYSIGRDPGLIRDGGAHYGPRPAPSEGFRAAGVLDDLAGASDEEIPLVLARYTALRAWLLRAEGAAPALVRHARSAARAHLATAPADWREREPLDRLLRSRGVRGAVSQLEEASALAEAAGHVMGARALRQAAQRARWPVEDWPGLSPS